jgi:hypothetical protein
MKEGIGSNVDFHDHYAYDLGVSLCCRQLGPRFAPFSKTRPRWGSPFDNRTAKSIGRAPKLPSSGEQTIMGPTNDEPHPISHKRDWQIHTVLINVRVEGKGEPHGSPLLEQ